MPNKNQQTPLLPVYLVVGEDQLKRDTVVDRLNKRLSQLGDLAFNSDRFHGDDALGGDIVSACNTLPFLSEVRLVRVDDVERLKKADSEILVDYMAAPCESTVLLLVANKLAKNTRLYKAIAKISPTCIIDCAPQSRRDLAGTVQRMARTHGVSLTPGAANALIDLVGVNTVALDSEVRKLALGHRGGDPINENEVFSLVSRTAEVKPWDFLDAFSGRSLDRCLQFLHKMQGSTSVYGLMSMCVTRIRDLITCKALTRRGEARSLAKVLKKADWQVRNYNTWAKNYSLDELLQALESARDTEQAMKSGANPEGAFIDWLVNVLKR